MSKFIVKRTIFDYIAIPILIVILGSMFICTIITLLLWQLGTVFFNFIHDNFTK